MFDVEPEKLKGAEENLNSIRLGNENMFANDKRLQEKRVLITFAQSSRRKSIF